MLINRDHILKFATTLAIRGEGGVTRALFHAGRGDRDQPNIRDWAEEQGLDVGGGRQGTGFRFSDEAAALMRRGFIVRWRLGSPPHGDVWYSVSARTDPDGFRAARDEAAALRLVMESTP